MPIAVLCCVAMVTHGDECRVTTVRINELGESAFITCTSQVGLTFKHWLLPDLVTTVDDSYRGNRVEFLSGNDSLYISRVEMEHLGDYLCFTEDANAEAQVFKRTVYLYQPPLWEVYRMNVLIGGSAAAAFFVLATLLCCVNNYTWASRQRNKAGVMAADGDIEFVQAYAADNSAYAMTEPGNSKVNLPQED